MEIKQYFGEGVNIHCVNVIEDIEFILINNNCEK
jgi:hypothetical protein